MKKIVSWVLTIALFIVFPPAGIPVLLLRLRDRKKDHMTAGRIFLAAGAGIAILGLIFLISIYISPIDPTGWNMRAFQFVYAAIPFGVYLALLGGITCIRAGRVRKYRSLILQNKITGFDELAGIMGMHLSDLAGELEELIRDEALTGIGLSYRDHRVMLTENADGVVNTLYCTACGSSVDAKTSSDLSCPHCGGNLLMHHRITHAMAVKLGVASDTGYASEAAPSGESFPEKSRPSGGLASLILFLSLAIIGMMTFSPPRLFAPSLIMLAVLFLIRYLRPPKRNDMVLFSGMVMLGLGIEFTGIIRANQFFAGPLSTSERNPAGAMILLFVLFFIFLAAHLVLRRRRRDVLICRHLIFEEQISDPEKISSLAGLEPERVRDAVKLIQKEESESMVPSGLV